jgi:hypothetical protein
VKERYATSHCYFVKTNTACNGYNMFSAQLGSITFMKERGREKKERDIRKEEVYIGRDQFRVKERGKE